MAGHKVLVTGATGLLGGNLARLLVRRGEAVKVLVRTGSNTRGIDDLPVERVQGDVTDRASLVRALCDCDRVFHAAALVSLWRGAVAALRRVNVGGSVNVFQAAMDAAIERVVYVSTVDTIGMRSRENPSDEDVPYEYAQYRNAYSLTKHEAEQQVRRFVERGLPIMVGCPGYMFGAYDVRPSSGRMILECRAGRTLLAPTGGNSFVDVLDVCQGLIALAERGKPGTRYILANTQGNLSYREIFSLIAEVVGGRKPIGPAPRALAMLAGYLTDLAGTVSRTPMQFNSAVARMAFQPHYFSAARAIGDLGLPQSPLRGAIRRAWEWFVANGYAR
jgi:dihydroflavonol-4-reductase